MYMDGRIFLILGTLVEAHGISNDGYLLLCSLRTGVA